MKMYTFTYTKKEVMEFCLRAWWEMRRRRPVTLLAFLLLFISYASLLERFPYEVLILIVMLILLELGIVYTKCKKEQSFQERCIWIEDGLLKFRSASVYHETACSQISHIKESKRLLMLGIPQKKNQFVWFVIPTRVFSSAQEQYEFMQNLKNPIPMPASADCEPRDFAFSFMMDIDKWSQVETEARAIFHEMDRHNSKLLLIQFIYYLFLYIVSIWFLHLLGIGNIFSALAMLLFLSMVPLRSKISPEKFIRKNLQNSAAQSDLLGSWEVWFTASGIFYAVAQKKKVSMPWTEFLQIAETEHAFYLIRKDKRQFIPLPKNCLYSYEQAQDFLQYCRTKGLSSVQIEQAKYLPVWIFRLLLVLSMCFLLASGMWHGYQKSKSDLPLFSTYSNSEPVSPDSPTYQNPAPVLSDSLSIEEQAETLRSLGLTVSDELIDEIAKTGSPEEETMRNLLQDFPYTWLLMSLGSPEYDENFEITGYSDEVFWFDFESWDLEADYIHILEGMAALAKGSAIDHVENIRVDSSKVDWEKGRGRLTVSFDYSGETQICTMNVFYDWIDEDILHIYNDLLKDAGSAERFYAMGDDGQGTIIFFCTKEWAKEFEIMTNIKLEKL